MVSVRKSPNMMSITGRIPVIAAPTPTPVKPASEMGVSITRGPPNSSPRPDNTLNGVPASATSSPIMQTVESRRISSASASRTACANVSSRTPVSGINVFTHFVGIRIRSGNGKLDRCLHFFADFVLHGDQRAGLRESLTGQPIRQDLQRIAFRLPMVLFLLRAVILAADVTDVMPGVAVRIAHQKRRSLPVAPAFHHAAGHGVHRADVLPINAFRRHPERRPAAQDISRGSLRKMRVLIVKIVFADVDNRQLPERRQVHHLVDYSLPQRTLAKEAHRNLSLAGMLRRKRRARRDSRAARDDRVSSQVSGGRVGDVHRSALALAIPGFLT